MFIQSNKLQAEAGVKLKVHVKTVIATTARLRLASKREIFRIFENL